MYIIILLLYNTTSIYIIIITLLYIILLYIIILIGIDGSYIVVSLYEHDIIQRLHMIFEPLPTDNYPQNHSKYNYNHNNDKNNDKNNDNNNNGSNDEICTDELGWNYIFNIQMMYNMFEGSVFQYKSNY